ncbi:MAG: MFS transporter [Dehalococcoidia bacterium]|nr:MFS transporter [Dehalococcoidia bacterium]MDD5494014.1 MFS transporter [Dehalococcoidia bacterium]
MDQQYRVYGYRWVVLGIYMFVAALTQLYWLNFASIATYIEEMFKIPASDIQWFTLIFPLVQVLLTIPAGIIIDKIGFKWGVGIGAIFTGLFALLRIFVPPSFEMLLIAQAGISLGQPFVLNGVTKLATMWFSPKEEATVVGLGSLALFVGMIVSLGLTPALVQDMGFSQMLWIYGIAGLIGMLAFIFFIKPRPATPSRAPEQDQPEVKWGGMGVILKNRNFLLLGFVALIGIGVFNGLTTWLEKILHDMHNMALTDAGNVSAVLIFSGLVGCFVIPFISDKIGRRKPFLILAPLVGALCITALIFIQGYTANMLNGIALGFFLISALPVMLTMSAEITGPRYAGVSVGYLQLLGNVAAVILVPTIEGLNSATGQFVLPLIILAVLLLISFTIALFIRDTHPGAAV